MQKPIPYNGTEPYIFVSYSHKDMEKVLPIISEMQNAGYRVWYDEGIDPGTEWDDFVAGRVEDCSFFLPFLSENYMNSDNCKDELDYARDINKNRVLIYLTNVELPRGMKMRLGRLQAIYYYTYTDKRKFYEKLFQANQINVCLGSQGTPSPQTNVGFIVSTETLEEWFGAGVDAYKVGNYTEAVKWYRKTAEQGYAAAQYNLGYCYNNGKGVEKDFTEAVKWYRKAAEQGLADAQYNLGYCYKNGRGVEKNETEAVKWYRKAAEQGLADAQYNLGYCYNNGKGVEQDSTEAVKWYRKAAEQGDADAQYELGDCYKNGRGVEKDETEAVKWYRKAAEQGHASAQDNLGDCYYLGSGVEQDFTEAVKWYRKAAEQGHASAQYDLGYCYKNGKGVEKDFTEAVKWYRKAAEQGHPSAQRNLEELL